MTKSHHHRRPSANNRDGLILLIVLGMLAMFSLLAVTYVVASSSSILGSRALRVRERNQAFDIRSMDAADKVARQLIRGTSNRDSIFFFNSLLGDVYGPDAIRSSFGPYGTSSTVHRIAATSGDPEQSVNLVKVTVNPDAELNGPLSPLENEYNSRILTILEGPLAGNSFRIHKYVGYANDGTQADPNHVVMPNIPSINGNPPPFLVPWNPWTFTIANAQMQEYLSSVRYSVLIDLNEIKDKRITGEIIANDGTLYSITRSVNDWISSTNGLQTLFFAQLTTAAPSAANMVGYKFVINDAPFNHAGVGLEDVIGVTTLNNINSFGNIDSRGLFINPRVSPSLLTNYSYLNDSTLMRTNPHNGTIGVDTVGTRRTHQLESRLIGASNEGYDVPDWRDAWLAHQTFIGGVPLITPSFHRPEVINHISHLFGNPSALTATNIQEMMKLIQASTGRIMNVTVGNYSSNARFQQNNPEFPKLNLPGLTGTPNASQIAELRAYVASLINGVPTYGATLSQPIWDVDNDGDNVKDSVWVDPGLEIVNSPDGRRLKPLMAILVEDLDSRVNVNVAGDRAHGLNGFETITHTGHKRHVAGNRLSSGFGYGPAEISLTSFLTSGGVRNPANFLSTATNLSLFDQRYGARRYFNVSSYPVDLTSSFLDRVPGRRGGPSYSGNDPISQINEREIHVPTNSSRMPGLPLARRGSVGIDIDVFGNPALSHPTPIDGDPYNATQASALSEIEEDPYESNAMNKANMDDPFGLEELEAVLRRMDSDSSQLPDRLKKHLQLLPGYTAAAEINREITTRSAELRHPPIAAALKTVKNFGAGNVLAIESGAPSYMRYIQMLHSQRYRQRTFNQFQSNGMSLSYADDPELTYAAISELFPVEFSKGLRMDLNRPFGDGFDTSTANGAVAGDIDEPFELQNAQTELHVGPNNTPVSALASFPDGAQAESIYGRELKKAQARVSDGNILTSATRNMLAGRQILARNLYCLAQLIVPRDYDFPGMNTYPARDASGNIIVNNVWPRARIRARNLAQWAVNVVDFRDADSAMTRFEYDILPFGVGTNIGTPAAIRPPYWAPDHLQETVNGVSNRVYCDVVWGLEFPELLLTESFAYHNKNLRNTALDANGASNPGDTSNPGDPTLDQFRFMDAGLLLELFNPRSVGQMNDPTFAGTSGGLYADVGGIRELDLARLAPAPTNNTPWGRQPVWRVALSEQYTSANRTEHPQRRLEANELERYTLQSSFETINGTTGSGSAAIGSMTNGTNVEQRLGNGLFFEPDHTSLVRANPATLTEASQGVRMPVKFDRFIWFSNVRPGTGDVGTRVPDLEETDANRAARHVYSATSSGASLGGTSYMVVGPKSDINFGSLQNNKFNNSPVPPVIDATTGIGFQLSPSYQRFSLASGSFTARNLVNRDLNAPFIANSKAPKALICKTDAPSDAWKIQGTERTIFHDGVGLNVSLPTPIEGQNIWLTSNIPTKRVNSDDGVGLMRPDNTPGFSDLTANPKDSWVDLKDPATGAYPSEPFDRSNPLLSPPVAADSMYQSGSYENVRAAYLQRLADPTLPYDPVMNPYITVDWISVDLTVFNGETDEDLDERDATNQMGTAGFTPNPKEIVFQSRYKTGAVFSTSSTETGITYLSPKNVWKPNSTGNRFAKQTSLPATIKLRSEQDGGNASEPDVNPAPYFNYSLGQERRVQDWVSEGASSTTFGYLNSGNFNAPGDTEEADNTEVANATTSDAFGRPLANANVVYRGAGDRMANLFWLNRQFANPLELPLVPRSSAGRLGLEFARYSDIGGAVANKQSPNYLNSYQIVNPTASVLSGPTVPPSSPDEFWNAYDSYWAVPRDSGDWYADWSLILEFVETQPPFADALKYFRPDVMRNLASPDPSNTSDIRQWFNARFLHSYLPMGYFGNGDTAISRGPSFLAPFHYNSNYVAAGKVNLNTVAFDSTNNSRVLKALEHLYFNTLDSRTTDFGADSTLFTSQFADSRRGYKQNEIVPNAFFQSIVNSEMDPRLPTRFAGAFVPPLQAALQPLSPDPAGNVVLRNQHSVDSTLLRADGSSNPFAAVQNNAPPNNDPLLIRRPGASDQVNQSNAFDRMQRAMRLANLTTNQSNVFAVWVTVGLFEYDPITGFGEEYQTPTGGVQRDRKFYIIDRTVPVGFKQGEDLNSRRTILLERALP